MTVWEPYPDEVESGGRRYRLDLDFRRVLMAFDVQDDEKLSFPDKLETQLKLLLRSEKDCPRDINAAAKLLKDILALFPQGERTGQRAIDFNQDARMIRSAFLRMGFDLTKTQMHFCQFLELLADIPADTALARVIELRLKPLPKLTKHNGDYIRQLQKAKAKVAIRLTEEEQRRQFATDLRNSTIFER